jgi:hypothetical protein
MPRRGKAIVDGASLKIYPCALRIIVIKRLVGFWPNRRLEHGQSMSALPRYIRHQLVLPLPKHHPLRCRDIWPCFRFWCGLATAVRLLAGKRPQNYGP